MASQLGVLVHDQNLNVYYNGASAGSESNVAKVPRKGGLGGRKPLGDLSNSVMPTPNQSLKRQNSDIFSYIEKDIGTSKSKIIFNGSKNKSKAPEKLQTSGSRKALSDISNSEKLHLHEAPKKNLNAKLGVVTEEHLSAITEEGFIHNHQECIKARSKKAMGIDEFLRTVGLDKGFPKQSVALQSSKLVPASPLRYLELPEQQLEDPSPRNYDRFSNLDSPPPCKTPKSPNHYKPLMDLDHVNFMLIESP